jgi:hypothetical protein
MDGNSATIQGMACADSSSLWNHDHFPQIPRAGLEKREWQVQSRNQVGRFSGPAHRVRNGGAHMKIIDWLRFWLYNPPRVRHGIQMYRGWYVKINFNDDSINIALLRGDRWVKTATFHGKPGTEMELRKTLDRLIAIAETQPEGTGLDFS